MEKIKIKLITKRNIDKLCRIIIPSQIRSRLGITSKITINNYEDNGSIVLKKSERTGKAMASKMN